MPCHHPLRLQGVRMTLEGHLALPVRLWFMEVVLTTSYEFEMPANVRDSDDC